MNTKEIALLSHNQFEMMNGTKFEVPEDAQDAMRLMLNMPQTYRTSAVGLVKDPQDTIAVLTHAQFCRQFEKNEYLNNIYVIKTEDVDKSYADRTYDWVRTLQEVRDPDNKAHTSILQEWEIQEMDDELGMYFLWDDRMFFSHTNHRYKDPYTVYGWSLAKYTDGDLKADFYGMSTHEDGLNSSDIAHAQYWFYCLTKWHKDGCWGQKSDTKVSA